MIPTYNCEKQITRVLDSINEFGIFDFTKIIVIDNRSKDSTQKKIMSHPLYLDKSIRLFEPENNNGLGGSHKLAFDYAIQNSFTHVAIFHGDDQGSYQDLIKMMKLISESSKDFSILGTRFGFGSSLINYSTVRRVGNLCLNLLFSIRTQKFLTDLGSGVNIFCMEDIKKIDYYKLTDSLTFNYELLLNICHSKFLFQYYPIEWKEYDQISNAKGFNIFFKALIILLFHSPRKVFNRIQTRYVMREVNH